MATKKKAAPKKKAAVKKAPVKKTRTPRKRNNKGERGEMVCNTAEQAHGENGLPSVILPDTSND